MIALKKERFKRRIRKITALAAAVALAAAITLPVGTDMSAPLFTTGIVAHAQEAGAFIVTGGTEGTDYRFEEGVLTVLTDTPLTIGNIDPTAYTSDRIVVDTDVSANITLNGVNIVSDVAFDILGSGNVTITLADGSENILNSNGGSAGLQKNSTTGTLLIQGDTLGTGKLEAYGGSYGAGIGGGIEKSTYNITLNNCIVYAEGGKYAAGIGGGGAEGNVGHIHKAGRGSNITINGGTVTAYGGKYAPGIGGGYSSDGSGTASKIKITGGSVCAVGTSTKAIGGGKGKDAVTPTNGSGDKVYLFEIGNPDSQDIYIDGKQYFPVNHMACEDDTFLYAYLTADRHTVKLGEEVRDYEYVSTSKKFRPIPNAGDFDLSTGTDDLIYNGEPFAATVTLKDETSGIGEISAYKYHLVNSDGTLTYLGDNVQPVDAGTYQVMIDVSAGSDFLAEADITSEEWRFIIAPAELSEIAVTGITPPAEGDTLDTEAEVSAEYLTLGEVSWTDSDTKAKCDKAYTASVVVSHDSNHIFGSEMTATVNGEEAFVTKNEDGTAEVTYTFEKTGHSLTKIDAADCSCTEDGNIEHYKCDICGKLFTDENGEKETTLDEVTIPAAHKLSHVDANDPTCTESGNNEYYKCSVCGKLFEDANGEKETTLEAVTIPAAHKLSHVDANDPTCTKSGNTEHYKCDVCGKLFEDANGAKETTLEAVTIPAAHTISHVDANDATCTEDGNTEHYKCDVCGKLFTDKNGTTETTLEAVTIPAAHKLSHVDANDPTCTEDGNTEHYKCDVCGKLFADENGEKELTIQEVTISKGHNFGTACDSNDGGHYYVCAVCGEKSDIEEHIKDNGTVIKEATLTESGIITYMCTVCCADMGDETITATISSFEVTESGVVVKYTVTGSTAVKSQTLKFSEVTEEMVELMKSKDIQLVIDFVNYSTAGSDTIILTSAQMKAIEYVLEHDFGM